MGYTVYEGDQPYVFISYAHKDTDRVFEVVAELAQKGYRFWYDEGIAPGSEWPEEVAQHLSNAAMLMAFVSPNSMQSENCRREINFALSKQRPFVSIVLEKTEMPLGMEMQLSTQQSILRYNFATWDAFIDKILKCPDLAPCLGEAGEPAEKPAPSVRSEHERELALMDLLEESKKLHREAEYSKELKLLLNGWDLGSGNAEYYCKLGRCYRNLGYNKKALEYYDKAKELDPDDYTIYGNIAVAYSTMGQNAAAVPYFEKSIAMAEASSVAASSYDAAAMYANYALCLGMMGDIKGAKKYLKISKDKGYSMEKINSICKDLKISPKSLNRLFFF